MIPTLVMLTTAPPCIGTLLVRQQIAVLEFGDIVKKHDSTVVDGTVRVHQSDGESDVQSVTIG